jgi:hypothetical protein
VAGVGPDAGVASRQRLEWSGKALNWFFGTGFWHWVFGTRFFGTRFCDTGSCGTGFFGTEFCDTEFCDTGFLRHREWCGNERLAAPAS